MYYYSVLAEVYDSVNHSFLGFADTCVRASSEAQASARGYQQLRAEADDRRNLAVVYAKPQEFGPYSDSFNVDFCDLPF